MSIEIKEVSATLFFVSTHQTTIPEIAALSEQVIGTLYAAAETRALAIAGPIHYLYDGADGSPEKIFTLRLALPLAERPATDEPGPFLLYEAPAFRCIATDYIGGMPGIHEGYKTLMEAIKARGLRPTWESREIYKHWVGYDSPENVTELQIGLE